VATQHDGETFFYCFFSLLARLSQDSNMFRKIVIDSLGRHNVSFVLVHAWSCDAVSRMEERMAAALTAVVPGGHSA
jgi:hypothetical protein